MLKTLRDKAQNWIAKILLGLLIIAFSTWGIESWISGWAFRHPPVDVGNTQVTAQELKEQAEQQFQQMRAMFGGKMALDETTRDQIIQSTLDRLINEKLLRLTIQDLGLFVSDEHMKQQIQIDPSFKGKDGKFSKPKFESFLMQHNLSEADFITAWKMNLQKQTLLDTLFHEVSPPHILTRAAFNQQFSKRIVDLITLPYGKVAVSDTPTQEQLQTLYETLKKDFMTPETRDVAIISLLPDEDAEELYKRSTNLEDLLAAGKSFKEAGQLIGGQYTHLTSLKKFPANGLNAAQIDTLFSLKAGEETKLEERDSGGYQIMKVEQIYPAAPQAFEAVKEQVHARWKKEAQKSRALLAAQTIEKSIKENKQVSNLPMGSTLEKNIALSRFSETVAPSIREAVFSLHVGNTKIIEEPERLVVLHLKSIEKPTVDAATLKKYEADFSKNLNEHILDQFLLFSKNDHGVTIHQDVIDRLFKKADDE